MNRDFVISQFKSYVANFDAVDEGISLKFAHSLRVSAWCERLARALHLSQDDVDLAWIIGVLHDIGRFEQLREYHTFIDYQSMDHAKYGARYLFQDGHIRDFWQDDSQDAVMEAAISQHNVYRLADDLSPRQRLFVSSSAMPTSLISLKSVPMACVKVRMCGVSMTATLKTSLFQRQS